VRRWQRILGVLTLGLLLGVGGFVLYMIPRDDVPQDPDVVVVLGGAGEERAALGIELAERYDADLVFSSSARFFGHRLGVECDEGAICFEPTPENTAGEAENMAVMAEEHGWEHITVATSDFHTSRSRYLFRQCLGRDRVTVVGANRHRTTEMDLRLLVRESTALIAGATFRRAC
jgi:uncharacterized SAM-binding protein YcdF (DUF218 family)